MSSKGIISLLGCGWLGFPLAKSLISSGYIVKASITSYSKLDLLGKAGIDPYLVQFSGGAPPPNLEKLFSAGILIITIPPGRRDPRGFENYRRMIRSVCSGLPESTISKIILISSTSVYADKNDIVNEFSATDPQSGSGKLMAETEEILAQQNVDLVSLRLAGLIGPGRMPGKFFAGKTGLPDGHAPVNLIHLNDAVGIIRCLIRDQGSAGVYNGCAPGHPAKEEFYTLAARVEGLEAPQFIAEKTSWKIVSSVRLTSELGYSFEFPSPMEWLYTIKRL